MRGKILVLIFGLGMFAGLIPLPSTGQNAPVTTLATVGNALPGTVNVPITVTGFSNIGAVSLTFDYVYAGLHYISGTPHPQLGGFAVGDQDLGNGKHRVTMGWFGFGASLPDGSVIMTLTFNYLNGIIPLEFYDNGASCEYADASFNVLNDIPQNAYYINGLVCGQIPAPGPVTGDPSVCQGESGVAYSIQPSPNATAYAWSVPAGALIASGNNTSGITVDFSLTAVSGTVSVSGINGCGSGPASSLQVTVNGLPVANAGPDKTIPYGTNTTLSATSGGSGTYAYHWSPESLLVNPNLQQVQTVNLTATTLFTLLVTNTATSCAQTDEVIVTITGGPLNANPVAIPAMICRGTPSQLYANAGGGSGNYSYAWSCTPQGNPPWASGSASPVVFPDSSKVYQVIVNDGFNTFQATTQVTVNQLPSAHMSGGDTLCGEGVSTVLTVDLTGTPPWSFWYSNGVTTWSVANLFASPYPIVATEPGTYTLLAMTDAHCTGTTSGSAVVAVYPYPPTPVVTVNGNELFSSGCCGNQWYKEGIEIAGATGQVFAPQETAHYFDIVTVNGCSSDTSNEIYYLMEGIGGSPMTVFRIEPNPATDQITLKSPLSGGPIHRITLTSMTGCTRMEVIPGKSIPSGIIRLNVGHIPRGMCLITIIMDNQVQVARLVLL